MEPSIERSIAERTEKQLGLITIRQLTELGVSRSQRRRVVSGGRLRFVGKRTLTIGGVPMDTRRLVMAACLDTGGVASHRTAAWLRHLISRAPARPDVTVRKNSRNATSELALIHTSTNLPSEDVDPVGPIPCTTIARTILGLAALVPEVSASTIRDVIDTAARDGKVSDQWLAWRLDHLRCRGRNGVTVLDAILTDRAGRGRTESWLERAFLDCLSNAGLPLPIVQRSIGASGGFAARVDFLDDPHLVAIEVDGHGTHSTKAQRDADARRANKLQLLGLRVLRFTYDDVVERPEQVIATVVASRASYAGRF